MKKHRTYIYRVAFTEFVYGCRIDRFDIDAYESDQTTFPIRYVYEDIHRHPKSDGPFDIFAQANRSLRWHRSGQAGVDKKAKVKSLEYRLIINPSQLSFDEMKRWLHKRD